MHFSVTSLYTYAFFEESVNDAVRYTHQNLGLRSGHGGRCARCRARSPHHICVLMCKAYKACESFRSLSCVECGMCASGVCVCEGMCVNVDAVHVKV